MVNGGNADGGSLISQKVEAQKVDAKEKNCGAMAEQRRRYGGETESAPQQFVHLVGCRKVPAARARVPPLPKS